MSPTGASFCQMPELKMTLQCRRAEVWELCVETGMEEPLWAGAATQTGTPRSGQPLKMGHAHTCTHTYTHSPAPVLHEDEQNGAPAAQGRGRSHGRDPAL